ncbi:MAG: helix-turn-helix transcriptional regulator [Eubacteriales bacterium]|nr:helix-turn-helix transcriptional regulator [Eubacteriales bacterium]
MKNEPISGEFGAYLRKMRIEKDAKVGSLAKEAGISIQYLSDIMKGHRYPPKSLVQLEALANGLQMTCEERDTLFDLAGSVRRQVAPDLISYVMDPEIPSLRMVLRKARDLHLGDDFWQQVMEKINTEDLS